MLTLTRGPLEVEVATRPFAITVRYLGRRLMRNTGVWIADGTANDYFVALTEGVIPQEDLKAVQHAQVARVLKHTEDELELSLTLSGGSTARLEVSLQNPDLLCLAVVPEGEPLRVGLEWDRRSQEAFVGLGARHTQEFDQRGRTIQLGADRRYTAPDTPKELDAIGGIPQGDYAPMPWMTSSRGYSVLVRTSSNGVRFDLSTERTSISTRAAGGPLEVQLFCQRSPAARLRALCSATGFPAVEPEWGYGFWKSRDMHDDTEAVFDDLNGFRRHGIPLDAIVIDSPWASHYNSWEFNPFQFPDPQGMIDALRSDDVELVLWCTPWVNIESGDGQVAPQTGSEALLSEPSPNYAPGAEAGHFVKDAAGNPFVARWWMGLGSPIDFTNPAAEKWWREQVERILEMGVAGIKADDGEGYYVPDHVRFADGRNGTQAAWANGTLYRESMQRALDNVHPGHGVVFGRCGWTGQQATGFTWAGDQASDFWSLRALVVAGLSAAMSGISNWSHDVGGYLGRRAVERCRPELMHRWVQLGCFTPLMQAHARLAQEPWVYSQDVLEAYRAYVLLHEQLVPYVRAAAATAARTGLPIIRPLCLIDPSDPRGWTVSDAFGYGPALWVAPVLDDGAREREVALPRGEWIETWSGMHVVGGNDISVDAPIDRIPVWVRNGSIVVTYPAEHVSRGLGRWPEGERPLVATLWGKPKLGHTGVRLADGTAISWRAGRWSLPSDREIETREL